MRADEPHFTMRVLARQDYVIPYPGKSVDQVQRNRMFKDVEYIVVVESQLPMKSIGVVRANGILRLRRWLLEEEAGG